MKSKFKTEYDEEADIFTIYRDGQRVKESVEVSEEIILDYDRDKNIAGLEIKDAYEFLHTINSKFTKKMLLEINNIEMEVKNFRNYRFIILTFKYNRQIITEKLPAFSISPFESPLIASAYA